MSVSPEYRDWILEQLRQIGTITGRSMFGGIGLYSEGIFFGLIADDVLYLKVDEMNRGDFEAAGSGSFRPYGEERAMQYYEVPPDVLEDRTALAEWADRSIEAGRRARKT